MSAVVLPRVDPFLPRKDVVNAKNEYVSVDPLWLANLVDTINEAMTLIEANI